MPLLNWGIVLFVVLERLKYSGHCRERFNMIKLFCRCTSKQHALVFQTMDNCNEHNSEHLCCASNMTFGVHQSLSEIEFERGIWHAAQYGDLDRVQILLKKGVPANMEDSAGYQAIHYAARNGHYRVCKMLLENGADVNARTRCGLATALHRAATQGHVDIIELLLLFGADTNLYDADGCTALHRALMGKCVVISKLLIPHTNLACIDNSRYNIEELAKASCCDLLPLILTQQSNNKAAQN